jgi:hypothetical protein
MKHEYARAVVTLDDGTCAILSFLTLGRGPVLPRGATWEDFERGWWRREATEENLFDEVLRMFPAGVDSEGKPLPRPTNIRRIADGDIPSDRTYRDAWIDAGSKIDHDMAKARAVHLNRVRHARAVKLETLDRDWMRATGQNKKQEADSIEARRQALRDLPKTLDVDAARTIDELKAKWSPDLD